MQEMMPPHVRQAVDEAWVASLEQQARVWRAARSERKSATDSGVLVIHRPSRTCNRARGTSGDRR